jgi:hypothetical protein
MNMNNLIDAMAVPKLVPNAVRMSTATLAAVKRELNAFTLPTAKTTKTVTTKTLNGMKIIIDDGMDLNTFVLGFYSPSEGFRPA